MKGGKARGGKGRGGGRHGHYLIHVYVECAVDQLSRFGKRPDLTFDFVIVMWKTALNVSDSVWKGLCVPAPRPGRLRPRARLHTTFPKVIYRLLRKKGPVLLSTSQAQPGRTSSQLSNLSFAQPCTYRPLSMGPNVHYVAYQLSH